MESAFISLFNKLYSDYSELLLPIKQALQELEVKRAVGNNSIIELRRNILQLKEQLKVVATLRNKIDKLSKDIRLLSQTEDTTLKDIEMLIDYFEKRKHIMIEFESEAFEFLIDKIVVKDNILEFHIMGGLIFTEEI